MEKKEGKGIILKGSGRENGCQDLEESLLPLRKGCTRVTKCAPLPRSPFREAAPLPLLKQPCLQISGSRDCREGAQEPGCAVAALALGSTSPLEHRRYL